LAEIEYFYSAHSAFAYLGSAKLMAVARAGGHRLVHRPMDLKRVVAGAGSTPTGSRTDAFRAYFFGREIQRWSEQRGAPVVPGYPAHHFNDTTMANSMLVAATRVGGDLDGLAHAMLEAHWRDDADLADVPTLTRLADARGFDGVALAGLAETPEVRAAYDACTREAIDRSVFGSPTYFINGDMFYGQDRLEMVERALEKPYL
jgi:2-hydroxychromene-2-carboxylate isomerase